MVGRGAARPHRPRCPFPRPPLGRCLPPRGRRNSAAGRGRQFSRAEDGPGIWPPLRSAGEQACRLGYRTPAAHAGSRATQIPAGPAGPAGRVAHQYRSPDTARIKIRRHLPNTARPRNCRRRWLAHRELGDQRAATAAAECALALAEPDGLILPFAMTDTLELLEAIPRHETAHAALLTDILDVMTPASYPSR
jgi:hypothetical protein